MHININVNILFILASLLYAILSTISGCYAAVSIPGYEYVGEGSCLGANEGYHPSPLSVSATDTFAPNAGEEDCAGKSALVLFCRVNACVQYNVSAIGYFI